MISFTRLAILSFCHQQLKNNRHPQKIFTFSTATIAALSSSSSSSSSSSHHSNNSVGSSAYCYPISSNSRRTTSTHMSSSSSSSPSSFTSTTTSSDITNTRMNEINTGYLNAKDAYDLDQQLFSTGYTLEQLMELAGLAVAEAIYDISPPPTETISTTTASSSPLHSKKKKVLIVCGPGNNGGDGLVAARHLVMFGYDVIIVYPKRSSREEHYEKLVRQCEDVGIPIYDSIPITDNNSSDKVHYDVIIDAIFGFSFKGEAREPFGTIIQQMMDIQQEQNASIVAVDVPSGWNVDEGDVANTGMVPDVLISLTAPKLCSKEFQGRHFVGGRFLPPNIAKKYGIEMPPYPGVRQVMEITTRRRIEEKGNVRVNNEEQEEEEDDDDWAMQYAAYCTEKEKEEEHEKNDKNNNSSTPDENKEGDVEDWAIQYQNYCIEKEAKLKEMDDQSAAAGRPNNVAAYGEDWALEYEQYLNEKKEQEANNNKGDGKDGP